MGANVSHMVQDSSEREVSSAHVIREAAHYSCLNKLLSESKGETHLVVLQGSPDPDAISSAMALGFLAQTYEIETTILCFHPPSHHENRSLVKRYGIKLVQYSDDLDLRQFDAYSIVDSQKYRTPIDDELKEAKVRFFAFVDHHREQTVVPPAAFVDVRETVASTAAIFCEYLREAFPKGLEAGEHDHVVLATSLLHGIRSDTQKFLLATRAEYEAAAYLAPCVDTQAIEKIERRVLTSGVLGILENALTRRRVHDNFIFSDVGFVRATDRDGIPQAAELLLAREGTDTVLVVGVVDEKIIDGSLRTSSETISPDEFLKGFLGVSPESGQYYGGGNRKDRGAFQIPLGFLGHHPDKDKVYSMALQIIEKSLLDYIGKASRSA